MSIFLNNFRFFSRLLLFFLIIGAFGELKVSAAVSVWNAWYGQDYAPGDTAAQQAAKNAANGSTTSAVVTKLQAIVSKYGILVVPGANRLAFFGFTQDPYPNQPKTIAIDATVNGVRNIGYRAPDGQDFWLPQNADATLVQRALSEINAALQPAPAPSSSQTVQLILPTVTLAPTISPQALTPTSPAPITGQVITATLSPTTTVSGTSNISSTTLQTPSAPAPIPLQSYSTQTTPSYVLRVTYGSKITLLHSQSGNVWYLCSKNGITYEQYRANQKGLSSGQQMVFARRDIIDNAIRWVVKGAHGSPNPATGTLVKNGDIIRLTHVESQRNLHSHNGALSPLTWQQEVTAFGTNGVGDTNDNWRVECNGDLTIGADFRLVHVNTNYALHSHSGFNYTTGSASGNQEVTAFAGRDGNDFFKAYGQSGLIRAVAPAPTKSSTPAPTPPPTPSPTPSTRVGVLMSGTPSPTPAK